MHSKPLAMVFDVESVGLHGDAFAVAYVVVSPQNGIIDESLFACDMTIAKGTDQAREWCLQNIPALHPTHHCLREMRDAFWNCWMNWQKQGAILVAEAAWPVEARFLNSCVEDDLLNREWNGPHPLFDLTSMQLINHGPPLCSRTRSPENLPEHHPLLDARHSAQLWMKF